jgi:hypothetical protein
VQFLVVGHEDLADPAASVRPQNVEALPPDVDVPTAVGGTAGRTSSFGLRRFRGPSVSRVSSEA